MDLRSAAESSGEPPDKDSDMAASIQAQQRRVCERRHAASTAALCTCTFIQAYLLISVFPYAGYMAIDLVPGVNEESAGSYAGLIASSFMAGRTFSAYPWGKLADRYGRRPVLLSSLLLSAFFSLLFGLSKTFWFAMVSRFLLGFSNGIQGTAKTAVTEIAHGDERLEARGTGIAIGMRGVGFLLSPAIGGILAEPVRQFSSLALVVHFEPLLSRFPFLLPNVVGALLCGLSALTVALFVEETLPEAKRRDMSNFCHDSSRWFRRKLVVCIPCRRGQLRGSEETLHLIPPKQPFIRTANDAEHKLISSANGINGIVIDQPVERKDEGEATMASIWKQKSTRKHLIAYWLFSFVVVCVDEAFPLYCISRDGGLSLSEASIGKILSAAGVIFVLGQYYAFATLVDRFGLYQSLTIGTLLGVPLMALIPIANILNAGAGAGAGGEIKWTTFAFLALLMGAGKIFSCLFFAGITIATNRTVPASLRATTNGLSMVGGSISKGLGPTFAGVLVAFSMTSGIVEPKYGSILVWSVIGVLGLFVVGDIASLSG